MALINLFILNPANPPPRSNLKLVYQCPLPLTASILINNAQIESDARSFPSALSSDSLLCPKQEIIKEERQSRIKMGFYLDLQVDELGLENGSDGKAYNKEQGPSKRRWYI
jgi:hypothetical protein